MAIGVGFTRIGGSTVVNDTVEHDWDYPYDYIGVAPFGSATSAAVWTITRIEVADDGTTTTKTATNVAWDDHLTEIYS